MKSYGNCPYCGVNIDITDLYTDFDFTEKEDVMYCLRCKKGYVHTVKVSIDLKISSVEKNLETAKKQYDTFKSKFYIRRRNFLEKMLQYNKKIDNGTLSKQEIEDCIEEWIWDDLC